MEITDKMVAAINAPLEIMDYLIHNATEMLCQLYFGTSAQNKAALECLIPDLKEQCHFADASKMVQPAVEQFTEKIKTFQARYKYPEIVSIKGAMAFMARMFYQYPYVARLWYEQLPKATMDNARKER